jgi:hypothetical protein
VFPFSVILFFRMATARPDISTPAAKRAAQARLLMLSARLPWHSVWQSDLAALLAATRVDASVTGAAERVAWSARIGRFFGVRATEPTGDVQADSVPIRTEFERADPDTHRAAEALLRELFLRYTPDARAELHPSSLWSPVIAFAQLKEGDAARRTLLDGARAIVIKQQDYDTVFTEHGALGNVLRDFFVQQLNGLLVGHTLNELVDRYATAPTPHFAYLLDWALLPRRTDTPAGVLARADFARPVQYVVEEAGGARTLVDACAQFTVGPLLAITYELLHALEAFWLCLGGVHNDLNPRNVLVKDVSAQRASYADAAWAYSRANIEGPVVLPAAMHRNQFIEIIDFGYSRCWAATAAAGEDRVHDATVVARQHRGLVGPEDWKREVYPRGEFWSIRARDPVRSRDVRCLGITFLWATDFARLAAPTPAGGAPDTYAQTHREHFISLVGFMAHTRFCFQMFGNVVADTRVRISDVTPSMEYETLQAWTRCYGTYSASADSYGSRELLQGTLTLNALLQKHVALRNQFTKIFNDYLLSDRAEEWLKISSPAGRTEFATPTDCLDLSLWEPLRVLHERDLPQPTVPVANVTASQVLRDPVRNRLDVPLAEIPARHRRFLGVRPTGAGTFGPPRDDDGDTDDDEDVGARLLQGCARAADGTAAPLPFCVYCEQPAQQWARFAADERPVCGLVCARLVQQQARMRGLQDAALGTGL